MKSNSFFIILFGLVLFISCSKDKDLERDDRPKSDVFIPEYDNKAFGVYRGLIYDPSGYYMVELKPTGSMITLVYSTAVTGLEQNKLILTSNTKLLPNNNVKNLVFENEEYGIKVVFNVDANGSNPAINIKFGDNGIISTIIKEVTTHPSYFLTGSWDLKKDGIQIDGSDNVIFTFSETEGGQAFFFKSHELRPDGYFNVIDEIHTKYRVHHFSKVAVDEFQLALLPDSASVAPKKNIDTLIIPFNGKYKYNFEMELEDAVLNIGVSSPFMLI
jgi:hypothetical protein